jgi:regulator of cell morphogenesis and NO signaling
MFLQPFEITPQSFVRDIVVKDYRTADIFRKYDIEYCCGGKWPLETVCLMKGVNMELLVGELRKVTRNVQLPHNLPFEKWKISFLVDYITNVHHHYLKEMLPPLSSMLEDFAAEHAQKYPYFHTVLLHFKQLENEILPHIRQEEEVIFPYLRQVTHAYESKESFAGLLVRTLRKPIASLIQQEDQILNETVFKFRQLTNNYIPPEKACASHIVVLAKLKELDNDLTQHVYLENKILFPRVISMEAELLRHN